MFEADFCGYNSEFAVEGALSMLYSVIARRSNPVAVTESSFFNVIWNGSVNGKELLVPDSVQHTIISVPFFMGIQVKLRVCPVIIRH